MSVVIKYGGSAMTNETLRLQMAKNISILANKGESPIVVHGGGPFIQKVLEARNVDSEFVNGLRKTTLENLPIIEQVLTQLSKILAQNIGKAIGLTGRDNNLLVAEQKPELGLVGDIVDVNCAFIKNLLALNYTPVIACIAATQDGQGVLNVNADSVAGAVAGALTTPVVFLSDVAGVLADPTNNNSVLRELSARDIQQQIEQKNISGGMIPKVQAALSALEKGASFAVIADGREPENLLLALTGKVGTCIIA